MGIIGKVSVCVSGLSININSDGSISSWDQSVEKGDLFITLELDCKRNVPVNVSWRAEVLSFLNDVKSIVDVPWTIFGRANEILIAWITYLDLFHVEIVATDDRTNRAAHGTTINMLINSNIKRQ